MANVEISSMTYKVSGHTRNLSIAGGLLITTLHEVRIFSDKVEYTSVLKSKEESATSARIKKVSGR